MKKLLSFFAVIIILHLTACTTDRSDLSKEKENLNEVIKMMKNESNYLILDVRRPEEYKEGHIPNAINIPNEILSEETVAPLKDKNQLIIVYCRSGARSRQASEKLVKLGYTRITDFGGIDNWDGEIVRD